MKKLFSILKKKKKSYFFKRSSLYLTNNIKDFSQYSNIDYDINGINNNIFIHSGSILSNVKIIIKGDNHKLVINKNCNLKEAVFWFEDNNCEISIGDGTTAEKGYFAVTEPNRKIILGKDCMVSKDVSIRTGDSHSIIDLKTKKRINFGKDVVIGNHVWLGLNTSILKGVRIGNNSIVGNGTILSKNVANNTIVVGNPARIIKENINWDRERI